jgi:signal transduction histidine kinase/ActR/RegA family two-component response regulator
MLLDELIRARRDAIVHAFVDLSRVSSPPLASQPRAAIIDHVPVLLDALADAIETGRTSQLPAKVVARQHAQTRWQQGVDIRTLVREYGLLRRCVLDAADDASPLDLATLNRYFETSVADAVAEFAAMSEENEAVTRRQLEADNLRLKTAQSALALLSEAGDVLASATADHRQAVQGLARLCVPRLGDCCAIYMRTDGGPVADLTVVHVVPEKAALVREIYQRFPVPPDAPHGFPEVVRSGKTSVQRDITDAFFVERAQGSEHLLLLRQIGATSWMVVPLRLAGNEPFGALVLFNTESQRNVSDEDVAIAEELARRASLVIDNARLFEALRRERARAEEATRAKDEFLATVSHEIRAPLNAVLGWSRLLRGDSTSPQRVARGLEVIERNALAQTRLVEDLLDVSRIITGNLRLEIGSVDISNVVEMALEGIRPAVDAKTIALEVEVDRGVGIIRGDPNRLQQVAWNLLTNAVKFTPKRGKVRIRLVRAASDIELTVSDDGAGIDPDALPFIFERFRQEDASSTRRFGGLGLGLAITRHLVELHGGTISATSPGKEKGSTFVVRIPISPVTTTSVTRPVMHPARPVDFIDDQGLSGMRVLVVDDEEDARDLLVTVLGGSGMDIRAAASVAAAMDEFRSFRPDLVLSDIGMPGEDGYSLARKIRALSDAMGGNTPMIALTAFARTEDRTRALIEGFNAHVAKPVEPSDLLDQIAALRFGAADRAPVGRGKSF